jgi:hypothetical protein
MDKTGTSSIQLLLRDNRARLRELGFLVPETPGGTRHSRLGLYVKSEPELARSIVWTRQPHSDPTVFRADFERALFAEIESSGVNRVIFTDEGLFGASEATLGRLGRFAHKIGTRVRLLAYLRRQDDHLVSRYQQQVKVGWVQRLEEYAAEDWTARYDYLGRLRTLDRVLAPAELVVRRFERTSFPNGSIYQDFLDAAGVPADAEELERGAERNQSLDAESVEFLRLLNLYRVENNGAVPGLIDNRRRARRLAEAATGPTLSLPAGRLDEFMAQWADGNTRVAQEYLHDPGGQLFRMPRKTAGITTEQRLDPDRLDHFLALMETPERMHAPLRRLAEREAKAG